MTCLGPVGAAHPAVPVLRLRGGDQGSRLHRPDPLRGEAARLHPLQQRTQGEGGADVHQAQEWAPQYPGIHSSHILSSAVHPNPSQPNPNYFT